MRLNCVAFLAFLLWFRARRPLLRHGNFWLMFAGRLDLHAMPVFGGTGAHHWVSADAAR